MEGGEDGWAVVTDKKQATNPRRSGPRPAGGPRAPRFTSAESSAGESADIRWLQRWRHARDDIRAEQKAALQSEGGGAKGGA
jgi:hypothetical protein